MVVFVHRLFRQCQKCARIRDIYGGDDFRLGIVSSGVGNAFHSMSLIGSSLILEVSWLQEGWYSRTGITRQLQLEPMERMDGFDRFTPLVRFAVSQNPMSGCRPRGYKK